MKYVISGLKGAFIAIVCGVLLTLYFGGEIDFESMTLILVYGFVQGAMSKVIDEYVTIALLEFVSQALASYCNFCCNIIFGVLLLLGCSFLFWYIFIQSSEIGKLSKDLIDRNSECQKFFMVI